jgi:hypothetical protein
MYTLANMNQQVNQNTKEIQLTEIQTILFSHAFQLDSKISDLLDIMEKAHDGIISGKLFRLPSFTESLYKLHRAAQNDIKLPFDIEKLHLRQLNAVADIVGHYLDNNVILTVNIPLSENIYDFYKVTSIPIPIGNGIFGLIDNNYPYVADNGHGEIILLSKEQYDKCTALDTHSYLCKHSMATYTERSRNCIKRLVIGEIAHAECEIKGLKLLGELWEPLENDNTWLYVVPESTQITVSCPKERSSQEISGVGILRLKSFCRASTAEVQLIAVNQESTLPAITINVNTKVLDNYNFTGIPELELEKTGLGHVDLQEVGTKVQLLPIANSTYQQQHTKDQLYAQEQRIHMYEQLLLGGVIGAVIIIVLVIAYHKRRAIWRMLFLRNKSAQTENQTTTETEVTSS